MTPSKEAVTSQCIIALGELELVGIIDVDGVPFGVI
jgi:hypothetical protein